MTYFATGPLFRKQEFVDLLNKKGIKAYVGEGGFWFDGEAFKAWPAYQMPQWVWMNRDFMLREMTA